MSNWGIRRVALALLALYVGGGLTVLLWPTPVDRGIRGNLANTLDRLLAIGVPAAVNYSFVEASANVLMFLPLGILLTLAFANRLWWATPLIGLAASASAEFAQLIFLPHRFATYDDVLHNTAGAILGTLIVLVVRQTVRVRRTLRPVIELRPLLETPLAESVRAAA
jgi:VanZ family protein